MKQETTTPIPQLEYLSPSGPFRFYFDHSFYINESGATIYTANFVEVEKVSRAAIIAAMVKLVYDINNEAALHRKMLANEPEAQTEFEQYNNYVNHCKAIVDSPPPSEAWTKAEIQQFLTEKGINFNQSATKATLLTITNELCNLKLY